MAADRSAFEPPGGPVVFGYDGSPASERALRLTAPLLVPKRALVVTVWGPGEGFEVLRPVIPPAPIDIRTAGTAIYLFANPKLAPPVLVANVQLNHVLHEKVLIVSVATDAVPRVLPARRSEVSDLGHGVHQVVLHYGFMEDPDVPAGLGQGQANRLAVHADPNAYFLGTEFLAVTDRPGMARWREHLFARLSRNATSAADYFSLPADCTITVGMRVEL